VKQRIPAPAAKAEEEVDEKRDSLFDLVSDSAPTPRIEGIAIGTVVALDATGEPLVDFPENRRLEPIRARSVVGITAEDVGREVALMFESGNPSSPIALGMIRSTAPEFSVEARVDRQRVVIEAESEIELRCGDASIVLSRDGKIRIRGKDLLSRSSGGNRIKGGSIRIN